MYVEQKTRTAFLAALLILVTAVTALALWQWQSVFFSSSSQVAQLKNKTALKIEPDAPSPAFSEQKIKPLKPGKQSYVMSHNRDVVGPRITYITLDPHDPQPNEPQTITINVTHTVPVTEATVRVISDNNTEDGKELTLIEGDRVNGVWQTTLKTHDSHLFRYMIYFELLSSNGDWKDSIVLR